MRATPLLLSFCLLWLNGPGGAQDAPPQLADLFSEMIDVRVVNLEVVVTDESGARVTGLAPEDFVLRVDGREVPIEYFTEVLGGQALENSTGELLPGLEAGSTVGTNYLVYVDDNHTRKSERDQAIEALIDQIDHLGPDDRMAVVVQHGTRLHMLSSWTRSERELTSALRQLLDSKKYGGSIRSPLFAARFEAIRSNRAAALVDVSDDRGGLISPAYEAVAETDSGLSNVGQRIDLELAVSGVVSTLRSFAEPHGRKVMLLIAGDWPIGVFRPDELSLEVVNDQTLTQPVIETANLLGYTIYPIGLHSSVNVWHNSSLHWMAEATGGRPVFEKRRALESAVLDTRSYYWLGFVPQMQANDARHRLEISVRRPGLDVRSRESYVDLSHSAQLSMMTQSALLFGDELPDGPIEVDFGRARRRGLRKMTVPVRVFIPLDRLTFIPQQGVDVAQIELRLAVIDAAGQQARIPIIPLTLSGDYEAGEVYVYETELTMRRRPHDLVVAVYDVLADRMLHEKTDVSLRSTRRPSNDDGPMEPRAP